MKESWQFEGDSSKVGSHVIRLSNEDDDIYIIIPFNHALEILNSLY